MTVFCCVFITGLKKKVPIISSSINLKSEECFQLLTLSIKPIQPFFELKRREAVFLETSGAGVALANGVAKRSIKNLNLV